MVVEAVIQQESLVLMCWMSWGLAAQASEKLQVTLLFRNGCIDACKIEFLFELLNIFTELPGLQTKPISGRRK